MSDLIDELLAIAPGDRLDTIRRARPQTRENAQRSHEALFDPVDATEVTLAERAAVALFTAALHGAPLLADYHRAELGRLGGEPARVEALAAAQRADGPFGIYREPGLSAWSTEGPRLRPSAEDEQRLGPRLAAALAHKRLLVLHPREADAAALQRLLDAGWSETGIVTLSQLVAFLAFQIRLVQGLGALGAQLSEEGTA